MVLNMPGQYPYDHTYATVQRLTSRLFVVSDFRIIRLLPEGFNRDYAQIIPGILYGLCQLRNYLFHNTQKWKGDVLTSGFKSQPY